MGSNRTIERPEDREDEFRVHRGAVRLLTIPGHRFVMVDGSGPAGGEAFEARMSGLYGAAYGLRFALNGEVSAGRWGRSRVCGGTPAGRRTSTRSSPGTARRGGGR